MTTKQAPSLPAAEKLGPRQREFERNKQEKKMRNKAQFYGVLNLYIKINFLLGGIALWKMNWVQIWIVHVPLFQVVAVTIFAVFAYMELKPYFANIAKVSGKKSKKQSKEHIGEGSLALIES